MVLFRKVFLTLRREGLQGLGLRLLNPRVARPAPPRPSMPFRLTGTEPQLIRRLSAALQHLLGPEVLSHSDDATVIHVNPFPRQIRRGACDVACFTDPDAALVFLAQRTDPYDSTTFLLPSAACLQAYRQGGLNDAQLFLLLTDATHPEGFSDDLTGDLAQWLISAGLLSPETVDTALFPALRHLAPHDRLCLSLPESIERRAGFVRESLENFRIMNGVRMLPGWQGCGWSYVTIARAALAQNATPLLVCEDDMRPTPDFRKRLAEVEAYLADQQGWDIFSGLLSNLSQNCRIHRIEKRGDLTFIHLNFTTGMVFNIYAEHTLARLAQWRPDNGDPQVNTIDAWLGQMPNLHVITTLPFLARHDTSATSTVFGFSNRRYERMISASEKLLGAMVARFEG